MEKRVRYFEPYEKEKKKKQTTTITTTNDCDSISKYAVKTIFLGSQSR